MIRLLLALIFVILFLILSIPLMIFEYLFHKNHPEKADRQSLAIVCWAFRVVLFLSGAKVTTKGKEKIPTDTAVLYVGNHKSYFDIVAAYPECVGPTGFIAKDNLEKVPLLSTWMRRLHCLFLNRSNVREGLKTILQGVEEVKSGVSMFIFPEGTRNANSEMLPFKEGSLKIAEKSGCPIVPVAITGSRDILENHMPFIHAGNIVLEYGDPIYPDSLDKEQKKFLGAYTQEKIQAMLNQSNS